MNRALTDRVNWAGMSHRELYDAANVDNRPDEAYAAAQEWRALGTDMIDRGREFAGQIDQTESGWQGEAADTARTATPQLTEWCEQAGRTAQATGDCLDEQARAAETAKATMPERVVPVRQAPGVDGQAPVLAFRCLAPARARAWCRRSGTVPSGVPGARGLAGAPGSGAYPPGAYPRGARTLSTGLRTIWPERRSSNPATDTDR